MLERKCTVKKGKQPEMTRIEKYTFKELAEKYVPWYTRQNFDRPVKGTKGYNP